MQVYIVDIFTVVRMSSELDMSSQCYQHVIVVVYYHILPSKFFLLICESLGASHWNKDYVIMDFSIGLPVEEVLLVK